MLWVTRAFLQWSQPSYLALVWCREPLLLVPPLLCSVCGPSVVQCSSPRLTRKRGSRAESDEESPPPHRVSFFLVHKPLEKHCCELIGRRNVPQTSFFSLANLASFNKTQRSLTGKSHSLSLFFFKFSTFDLSLCLLLTPDFFLITRKMNLCSGIHTSVSLRL